MSVISIEQLRLILYDTYQMDAWFPPLCGKYRKAFEKTSYELWTVKELVAYITRQMYPRKYGSVSEFYEIVKEFATMMLKYYKIGARSKKTQIGWIFKVASDTSIDILGLLDAMK